MILEIGVSVAPTQLDAGNGIVRGKAVRMGDYGA